MNFSRDFCFPDRQKDVSEIQEEGRGLARPLLNRASENKSLRAARSE
jgi:hypothetical protein